jgi:hypothetical protein
MEGFLGKFKEGVGDWGVGRGSVALLNCEEGVVDIQYQTTKCDKFDSAQNQFFLGQLEAGIILREAKNIENQPYWAFPMLFKD